MGRREFVALLGGAAAAWPLAARAQQSDRPRRVGVLMNFAEDDLEGQSRVAAFLQALQTFGWTVGHNLQIDVRWGAADAESHRRNAAELVALAPDVMLASASPAVMAIQQTSYGGPVVFVVVSDPVGGGFVDNLARPGGNVTGFTQFEYGLSAKWLELLKEFVPRVSRVAVIRNPAIASGPGQLGALQAVAPSLGVELRPVDVRNASELERALNSFARSGGDGLIATGGGIAVQRKLIVTLAARYRLPTIYPYRYFVADGGLMSYGPDLVDQYRQAADYVNRVLQGEKPAALPVQATTKHRLIINLQTAKALGLEVPPSLLARADEVIE
jgi:putative tryptophan/tyrosine transport system substrate-binding protein